MRDPFPPLACVPGRVALIALLLASAWPVPQARAEDDDISRIRLELGTLREEFERDSVRLDQARERIFELQPDIARHQEEQRQLVERIDAKRLRIDDLKAARSDLDTALERSRALLARNSAARYALAVQPRLKLLLNQDQVASLSRNLAYYDHIMRAYDRDLDSVVSQLRALDETRAALKLETNSLRRLRQVNGEQLQQLELTHDEHRAVIATIEKRMSEGKLRASALREDEQKLIALVEKLARENKVAAPPTAIDFGKQKGKLGWPTAGRVSKAPGRALRKGGARWAGVLIDGTPGSAVQAVADGQVVFADWFRNLGKLIIVDHGDGYLSLYGNNAEIYKTPGDNVVAGDTIATVGFGVGDMPAGLYFELRVRGQPVDPRAWCARR